MSGVFSKLSSLLVRVTAILPVMLLAGACTAEEDAPSDAQGSGLAKPDAGCTEHVDCEGALLCVEGRCQSATIDGVGCNENNACPQGYRCLQNGTCQAGVERETDSECCPPQSPSCMKTCVDFKCVGTACEEGGERDCFVGCHRGVSRCELGDWTPCGAPPVLAEEECDNDIDDDCDGDTDEGCLNCQPGDRRSCNSPCGEGSETCLPVGDWGECDAPMDCTCEPGASSSRPCGSCGTLEGICGTDNTWMWSELCTGEGSCAPEQTESAPCGKCGQQSRTCKQDCTWAEYGECLREGLCAPGEEEEEGCGNCGARARVCGQDCTWGEFAECVEGGGCNEGETQEQACGNCGEKVSVCDAACAWGEFSACQNEGECQIGTVDTSMCGNCGQKERTCGSECTWGEWGECEHAGPCTPGGQETAPCGPATEDGLCEFGERVRTCSPTCQWNAWGDCLAATYPADEVCGNGLDEDCDGSDMTRPDEYEGALTNDKCARCYWLGEDPEKTLYPTFDNRDDKLDYFCFRGVDNFNIIGFGEVVKVDATGAHLGMEVDLYLYFGIDNCEAGPANALAFANTMGGDSESIKWSESSGADDGVYYIEVQHYGTPSCYWPYTLKVSGLR